MSYFLALFLMAVAIWALRKAQYSWPGAIAGGLVATVTALIVGVAASQYVGLEHPQIGPVIMFAVAYMAFVGLTYRH